MAIIAEMTHKQASLTVEILDVFTTTRGEKKAVVQALAGSPFSSWTHGGWAESDTANIPADLLHDVRIA